MNWEIRKSASILATGLCIVGLSACGTTTINSQKQSNPPSGSNVFYNPILDNGADPWMLHYQNTFYLTMTTGNNVTLQQSNEISDIAAGKKTILWSPSAKHPLTDIWAPELHHLGQHWYVYFAGDMNQDNSTHRMYVLESAGNVPGGPYHFVGELRLPGNQWAIDGTILQYNNNLFFIWSGWPDAKHQIQNLYITKMSSPTVVSSTQRTLISQPTYRWEKRIAPINEGPEVLQHGGKTFLIYSADASWKNDYCLGMLTLTGDDPLLASSWTKSDAPVFQSSNGIFGPGHASFVQNGKQYEIVFHTARYSNAGWDRVIRAQPFTFDKDGTPDFGSILPATQAMTLPSSESSGWHIMAVPRLKDGRITLHLKAKTKGTYTVGFQYHSSGKDTANVTISLPQLPNLREPFPATKNSESIHYMQIYLSKGDNTIQITPPPSTVIGPSIEVSVLPSGIIRAGN